MSFERHLFLAPLAGYTDSAFRTVCRSSGASRVFTGMVSAEGIARKNPGSLGLLKFTQRERPVAVQLFGSNPASFGEAARIVSEKAPEFIDLNFGCPAKKILSQRAGAALLRFPDAMAKIVRAVTQATSIPVTAKIRIGLSRDGKEGLQAAKILEESGVALISVHARLATEGMTSLPTWDVVGDIKAAARIPIVANGGISTPQDAKRVLDSTGCDGIMIGQGAVGRPWIFEHIRNFLADGSLSAEPEPCERIAIFSRHFALVEELCADRKGFVCFKGHLLSYLKSLPAARALRETASRIDGFAHMGRFLEEMESRFSAGEHSWTNRN
ncbi:MAG: tRNA dihydrouridine synthase DusB [Candidatus Eisenbacteria bacterium]|nr:tRNA dihydrouridine synthase DusB [Candidatus Eisenbacteria bacterium]